MKHQVILVSSLPANVARMCFLRPARTLAEALDLARERQGKDARILVMPYGNLTLATPK